jgi:hypothetical protein
VLVFIGGQRTAGRNAFRYNPNNLLRGVLELHVEFDS